jgi:hypothetical protein
MAKKTNGLLKNHRSPFESLRANGAEIEIMEQFTFVLRPVEALRILFYSLHTDEL